MVEKKTTAQPLAKGDTIKALGETLMRKDLHSDAMRNREIEEEAVQAKEKREKRNVEQKQFRVNIRDTVIEQTRNRIKHVLGPSASQENVMYCVEPLLTLIEQQNRQVEESRIEVDGLQKIIESKNMDIQKLSAENDKFMQLQGGTRMWKEYEVLLAKERIINRRLLAMFADKDNEQLITEGKKNTYQEWLEQRAEMGTGMHNGVLFPRRRRSPRY